jgi:hypothetical protein
VKFFKDEKEDKAVKEFVSVMMNSKTILKNARFYEKETFAYYKRLITAMKKLNKVSDFFSREDAKKWKLEINKLADKEMEKLKKYHDKMKALAKDL